MLNNHVWYLLFLFVGEITAVPTAERLIATGNADKINDIQHLSSQDKKEIVEKTFKTVYGYNADLSGVIKNEDTPTKSKNIIKSDFEKKKKGPVSLMHTRQGKHDKTITAFADDILASQNKYRTDVGLYPFEWDNTLADFMQVHFENTECEVAHTTHAQRSKVGAFYNIGENILQSRNVDPNGAYVASAFYSEISCYKYGPIGDSCTRTCPGVTGHFTQLMWADATHVGCAQTTCENVDGALTVSGCAYGSITSHVGGNVGGEYPFSRDVAKKLNLAIC